MIIFSDCSKEKKGGEDSWPASPFAGMEALVAEDVAAKWSRAAFTVNREMYESDEALCAALETAVWVRELLQVTPTTL